MERLITEEFVTKHLIDFLKACGFTIFSYDFPQSGTGYAIRPNRDEANQSHKNLSIWIPDIIAFKDNYLCFFENKPVYSKSDIEKILFIKNSSLYTQKIDKLLKITKCQSTLYFIGYPSDAKLKDDRIPNHLDGEFNVEIITGEVKFFPNNNLIINLFKN